MRLRFGTFQLVSKEWRTVTDGDVRDVDVSASNGNVPNEVIMY